MINIIGRIKIKNHKSMKTIIHHVNINKKIEINSETRQKMRKKNHLWYKKRKQTLRQKQI